MTRQHNWDSHAYPGRTYHNCRRCEAKGITWRGKFKQTRGPVKCKTMEKAV